MENKSAAQVSGSDSEYDVVEGLSTWEFINNSDDEYDVVLAFTDTENESDGVTDATGPPPSSVVSTSLNYLNALKAQVADIHLKHINGYHSNNEATDGHEENEKEKEKEKEEESGNSDYEDDYYEEEDDDDMDDELVPMSVRGKFGKERIKKLGKRSGSRMNKSKKLAYMYNRPGCVRGLGVQHGYI